MDPNAISDQRRAELEKDCEEALKKDAILMALGYKLKVREKALEAARTRAEVEYPTEEDLSALGEAAERVEGIKDELDERIRVVRDRYFGAKESGESATARSKRREATFHDPTEEYKELKEVPGMPKLSEFDSKVLSRVLLFKRDFLNCMENTVPVAEKWKRYLLIAVPPRVRAKLNAIKRSEVSTEDMFEVIFKKLFRNDWKRKIENELFELIKQQSDESIEDFALRMRLYVDALEMDPDSVDSLAMLRRKTRPEYEEIWSSVSAHCKWDDWVEQGEAFELKPSFRQLRSSAKPKCNKCGKSGHTTAEHRDAGRSEEKPKGNCRFFPQGKCSRGNACPFKHVKEDSKGASQVALKETPQPNGKQHKFASREEWLKQAECRKCKKTGHVAKDCTGKGVQGFFARCHVEVDEYPSFEQEQNLDEYFAAVEALTHHVEGAFQGMFKVNEKLRDPVMFPALLGKCKVMCTHDSGSSYTAADTKIYTALVGKEVMLSEPIELQLAGEGSTSSISKFKECLFEIDNKPAVLIHVYDSGNRFSERVLISDRDAQLVSIVISNLPLVFPREKRECDRVWAQPQTPFQEQIASREECGVVGSLIAEALRANASIPQSSRCSLPDSKFKIDLKSEKPVYKHQYPYPRIYRDEVVKQHKEWLGDGRVERFHKNHEGTNEYNSPLNPVPKKSGGIVEQGTCRVTADLRAQNENTKEPTYILPRVADMLQKLQGCEYFAEIDLKHAYHQIEIVPESQKVTGFVGPDSHQYVWTVMVEGLKGAAAHMQWVLDRVLAPVAEDCSRYIDNVLVGAENPVELGRKLSRIIDAINSANLRLNPAKCKWCYRQIKFMGAIINKDTRAIDPVKVNVFQNMRRPKTGSQMESLLGFVNFVRDFIPLYACVTGPLEQLRKMKHISEEEWERNGAAKAFEALKKILSSAPLLSTIDWSLDMFIATDSSQYGVGAVLYQTLPSGAINYIDFAAKSLNKAQANYPASKRELLGVMFALKRWYNILLGKHFNIEVDNKALQYMAQSNERMILDWVDFILNFDFTITYKKGVLNVLPDCLSRLYDCIELDLHHDEPREGQQMRIALLQSEAQAPDRVAQRMHQFVREVLNKEDPHVDVREKLVKELHAEGHVGAELMFRTLFKMGYYWRTMFKDCEIESGSCPECLRFNIGRVGFHPLSPAKALLPFDHIAMDFIVLNTSLNGYNFILLIVDVLTRFILLRALKSKTAEEVAWVLLCVFADFGVPKIIQSDSDKSFFNEIMSALRGIAGFEQRRIMKYFPKANGLPERFVQEAKRLLEKWNRGDWSAWDMRVPALQMSLNDRILSIHKSKAFSVMFARPFNGFEDFRQEEGESISFKRLEIQNRQMIESVFPTIAKLEKERREEKDNLENSKILKKKKVKGTARKFEIGDTVMKQVDVREGSTAQRWEGPFTIVESDAGSKGFRLLNSMNRLVSGFVPAAKLRIVQYASDKDLTGFHEVKKILSHRGVQGNREYLIAWKKKGPNEWVHELDCDAYDLIKKYWEELTKKARLVSITNANFGSAAEADRPATPPLLIPSAEPQERVVKRASSRQRK